MNDIEELVIKWRSIFGWEEHLDDIDEQLLALKMETMAKFIIDLPYQSADNPITTNTEKLVETCVFPIIFRVMKGGARIGDVSDFYNELITYFNRHQSTLSEFHGTHIDMEAELCASFSEDYVLKKRDPMTPRKFLKPWVK